MSQLDAAQQKLLLYWHSPVVPLSESDETLSNSTDDKEISVTIPSFMTKKRKTTNYQT